MKELIENFPNQIKEALSIGESFSFKSEQKKFNNIVICGLGGSGIGASLLKDILFNELSLPITVVKGYFLPNFVDKNTLIIISSYSGNTEETLSCFEEGIRKKCFIVAVSSNGAVLKLSKENNIDCISIPKGMPPRACLGYSTVQLFYILNHFQLISNDFKNAFNNAAKLLLDNQELINKKSFYLAEKIYNKTPVIYSSDHIESIAIRWRQQINENSKMLCWHHVVPEMNHNELVGWRDVNEKLAVVILRNEDDFQKIQTRIELNKLVFKKYTENIFEIWSLGNSFIEKAMYLVHFGDYLSFHLSELRGFDAMEIKVINELKSNLTN